MTNAHKIRLLETYQMPRMYTIKEYAGESGDVVDPYGGTLVDYEECYIELARLVKNYTN